MYRSLSASIALFLLLALGSSPAGAQVTVRPTAKPNRLFQHKSIEQGWKSAVAARKPLLVMFTSDGCVYCKKMLKETYGHPAIEKMLVGQTESVLAHANNYQALVKKLGIRGYPSTVVVAPDGKVLEFMEGYVEPRAFAQRVHPLLVKRTAEKTKAANKVAVSMPQR